MSQHTTGQPSVLSDTLAWIRAHEWWVVAAFAILAFSIGILGASLHFHTQGVKVPFYDILYLSLRLFGLDYDLEVPPGLAYAPSNWLLQFARFLAPAVLAYGLFRVIFVALRDMFSLLSITDWKDHAVVCGAGERGKRLALTLLDEGHRVVVVEKDAENENLLLLREAGAKIVIGSATDLLHQKEARLAQAAKIVSVLPDPQNNVEVLLEAAKMTREYQREHPGSSGVSIHAHAPRELAEIIEEATHVSGLIENVQCRFFDHQTVAARRLALDTIKRLVPDFLDKPRAPRILIAGNERFPASFAAQLIALFQLPNCGVPEIKILSDNIDIIRQRLPASHPQLSLVAKLQLEQMERGRILSCDTRSAHGDWFTEPYDLVLSAFDDDFDSLMFARSIQQLSPNVSDNWGGVIVGLRPTSNLMRLQQDREKATLRYGHLVDLIELGCSSQMVFDKAIDQDAKAAHEKYRAEELKKDPTRQTAALEPWESLAEEYKNSNRRLTDNNQIKRLILEIDQTETMIEALAEAEHRSWTGERIVGGWTHNAQRDDARRLHPNIVAYEELSEGDKEKDRNTVRDLIQLLEP